MSSITNIELLQKLETLQRKTRTLETQVASSAATSGGQYLGKYRTASDRPPASPRLEGSFLILAENSVPSKVQWCVVRSDGTTYEWADGAVASS